MIDRSTNIAAEKNSLKASVCTNNDHINTIKFLKGSLVESLSIKDVCIALHERNLAAARSAAARSQDLIASASYSSGSPDSPESITASRKSSFASRALS